jgi:hypothetical protein
VVRVPLDQVDVPVGKRLSGVQQDEWCIVVQFKAITYGIECRLTSKEQRSRYVADVVELLMSVVSTEVHLQ